MNQYAWDPLVAALGNPSLPEILEMGSLALVVLSLLWGVFYQRRSLRRLQSLHEAELERLAQTLRSEPEGAKQRLSAHPDLPDKVSAYLFSMGRKRGARLSGVQRPPGALAHGILAWVVSTKTMSSIFVQPIADMRDEAIEDEVAGRVWHRRWVIVRGHIGLVFTCSAYLIAKFGKTVAAVWKLVG